MPVPQGNVEKGKTLFVTRCGQCHTYEKGGMKLDESNFVRLMKLDDSNLLRLINCMLTSIIGVHKTGPNLFGLFGRKTGQAPGYNFYF